ncbi:hypothetical protein M3Y99_00782600 [Aphelenchoides fujianensis]|nr:hypothetical protein M3Y99_00782600 [Aphelenchoides fujianensis]
MMPFRPFREHEGPLGASTSNSSNEPPSSWSPSSLSDFHEFSPLPAIHSDTNVGRRSKHPNRRKSPPTRRRPTAQRATRAPEDEWDVHREYPKTPRRTHRRRQKAFKCETFKITIPTVRPQCHTPPTSTDYATGSDENRPFGFADDRDDSRDFDDAVTDFMNATEKIYENLCNAPPLPSALPTVPPPVPLDDEPSLYGRLTALLLANSRGRGDRVAQVEAEVRALLQLAPCAPGGRLADVEDEQIFARSAAIFGHEVGAQLRRLQHRSPAEFQRKLGKLHKLLYGLKKRSPLFGGFGRFVQKLFKAI